MNGQAIAIENAVDEAVWVDDAGFEAGSLGPWQGWGIAIGSVSRLGSYGLTENPTSSNDVAYQDVYGLTPGQMYVVSAWVKATGASPVVLAVHDTQGNGWVQNAITATTNWQQISQAFTVDSTGALRIHLFANAGSQTTYWDDVTVAPLPPDAGFEAGSLGPWQGWGIAIGSVAHSGSYGLTESRTSSSDVVAYQDIYGLTPGQMFVVSGWVKATGTNTAVLAIHDTQGNGWVQNAITATTNWQQVSQAFTVDSTGALRIHLYAEAGSQTIYWDDVTVTPLPPDAGFEIGTLGPWQGWGIAIGLVAHSGSYGLTESPTSSSDVAYQDVYGLTPGQTYVISGWVRATGANPAVLAIHDTQGNGWVQNAITATTNWQQVSQAFTVDSTGALRIHLFANAGSQTTYWDDVSVVPQ